LLKGGDGPTLMGVSVTARLKALSASDERPRLEDALRGPALEDERRISDAFVEVARRSPEATAIVQAGRTYTYGELERLTRTLAARLRVEVRPDEVVAIYGRRDASTVVGMLASLRAGLAFCVLDSAYPAARLTQMLSELGAPRLVVIDGRAEDEPALAQLAGQDAIVRLRLDDGAPPPPEVAATLDGAPPSQIAYVLFTSGTTGVPKAIQTSHAPLVHFIDWYAARFAARPGARFSLLSGLAHDPVLRDAFVPLSVGAELHIPERSVLQAPQELLRWLQEARITHVHGTPQLFGVLTAGKPRDVTLPHIAYVFSGGDALHRGRALELLDAAPGATVVNFYGTTETPQAMGFHVFDPADESDLVPVGKGIEDAQVIVLDAQGRVAPFGQRAEVAIRSRYLSAGYLNDAPNTQRKFRVNPRGSDPDDRLYLTGDLGFFRDDGAVVVTGRVDDQVKVRGFRVELGEITRRLEQLPEVRAAIVLPDPTAPSETRLVAYLVGSGDTAAARAALAEALPAYMVPALWVWLPALPLLPNGKIDRARLAPPHARGSAPAEGPLETAIVEQWKRVLGLRSVGVDISFVDLGGDSLSFIQAQVLLEPLLGRLPEAWEKLTIRELASAGTRRRSRLSTVDTSVLIRAVSIISIVVAHLTGHVLRGSTMTLYIVAGMSFARYQLSAALRAESAAPVLRSVFRIALPTILYTFAIELMFSSPRWPALLLVTNLYEANFDHGLTFWFIELLVQNELLLAALLAVPAARRAIGRRPFELGLGLAVAVTGLTLVAPRFWNTAPLFHRVPHMSIWLMLLGWAMAKADTNARKLLCVLVGVVALYITPLKQGTLDAFPVVALVALAAMPRLRLPRVVASATNIVAGASLFIYLTHAQVASFARHVRALRYGPVGVVVALVAGIVAWKAWEAARSAVALRAPTLRG
jgi:amino acid adenylation domain-containing protein